MILTCLSVLLLAQSAGPALKSRFALHIAIRLATREPAHDGARTALVVDQFEEVFTLCHDDAERAAFLANLVYASTVPDGACLVILTLHADFYQRCAAYPDLGPGVGAPPDAR